MYNRYPEQNPDQDIQKTIESLLTNARFQKSRKNSNTFSTRKCFSSNNFKSFSATLKWGKEIVCSNKNLERYYGMSEDKVQFTYSYYSVIKMSSIILHSNKIMSDLHYLQLLSKILCR